MEEVLRAPFYGPVNNGEQSIKNLDTEVNFIDEMAGRKASKPGSAWINQNR